MARVFVDELEQEVEEPQGGLDRATVEARLTGTKPLMPHNGQLADPLNEYARKIKEFSGKRQKTEYDFEAMARIEFEGGMYWGDEDGPIVPAENLERALVEAGGLKKRGKDIKRAVVVETPHAKIDYPGRSQHEHLTKQQWLDALWDEGFFNRSGVVVQRSRTMRTRPYFSEWALVFDVQVDLTIMNTRDFTDLLQTAGKYAGLCDRRPRFGTFLAEVQS